MPIVIRLLGDLVLEFDDAPIELPTTQRRALIFFAIHANEVVTTDQIGDAVWSDAGPRRLDHAVHSLVYRLRRHLGAAPTGSDSPDLLERMDPGYRLTIDPSAIDANSFTTLARRGRCLLATRPAAARDLLTGALALWRGDALVDVAYDTWAAAEIRRLTEVRLCACEALADANILLGDPEVAVAELESLTERFPMRESLWVLLWKALAAAGRHLDVIASHRRATTLLRDQFEISPSPHFAELARTYALVE